MGAPESVENTASGPATTQDQDMEKLRVNLFRTWGEDTGKTDENASTKTDRSKDVVNYATGDMDTSVEMLDSSAAHIEY